MIRRTTGIKFASFWTSLGPRSTSQRPNMMIRLWIFPRLARMPRLRERIKEIKREKARNKKRGTREKDTFCGGKGGPIGREGARRCCRHGKRGGRWMDNMVRKDRER